MDLVNWSLNGIDTIFSTLRLERGERSCPSGMVAAGRVAGSWGWNLICLAPPSIEDVEDIYIFGFMITGFLLFGCGGILAYRKLKAIPTAVRACEKLSGTMDGISHTGNTQTQMLGEISRKLDVILTRIAVQQRAREE